MSEPGNSRLHLGDELTVKNDQVVDERGSARADGVVVKIKNTKNERERQKLLEELLLNIRPDLQREIDKFYFEFSDLLERQHIDKEDVYNMAVEIMMKFLDKWDREGREAEGKKSANFLTYFFHKKKGLRSKLIQMYVAPALRHMRLGHEISMDFPMSAEDSRSLGSTQTQKKASSREISQEHLLEDLYVDSEPLVSLFVILNFGLGKDVLEDWKKRFDTSVQDDYLSTASRRYVSKVPEAISRYTGTAMTQEEIGRMFGMTKENVRLKVQQALGILRDELK